MDLLVFLPALFLLSAIVNLPLGYLRQGYDRFTFGWFFYSHLSIPVIIFLRTKTGFGAEFFPLTLTGAVAGQFLGVLLARRRTRTSPSTQDKKDLGT